MVDVKAAIQVYNDGIIDNIIWIRIQYNLSDAMKKAAILLELITAIEKNQLHYEVEQSVKRSINSSSDEKVKVQL